MRERLVVTLVSLTVGIIAIFGVVRAYSTADLVEQQEQELVELSADIVTAAIDAREQDPPVTPSYLATLATRGQYVSYTDREGTRIAAGPASADDVSASRPLDGGRVTVSQSASVGDDRVAEALLPLGLLSLGLAAAAAVIGWLLARRLAHPFRRLAADATLIGDGHFDVDVHRSSISEAEELGNALRRAAGQLGELVKRERELSVVASHELRTPLTALRLSLEDLTLWPQTPPDVANELQHGLAEVDRLNGVITTLLERGDGDHLGVAARVDLTALAASAVARWSERAQSHGRTIVMGPSDPSPTRVVAASVDRVVDALIDTALTHGSGTITVDAVTLGTHLGLRVADEGPRRSGPGVVHESPSGGATSGLTQAATVAESLGGFLSVDDTPTTRFTLMLPRRARSTDI